MSLFFKATTPEGHALIGCHTKDAEHQAIAGVAIDIFTPLPGSNPAEFSQTGWVVRPVAQRVSRQLMDAVLESTERGFTEMPATEEVVIDDLGIVTREMMAAYMGETSVRKIFKQIDAQNQHIDVNSRPAAA